MSTVNMRLRIQQEASKYKSLIDFITFSPRTYRRALNYEGMTNLIKISFHPNFFIKFVMIEKYVCN